MCMRTWAWKPSPSTVAQSVINEILNIREVEIYSNQPKRNIAKN